MYSKTQVSAKEPLTHTPYNTYHDHSSFGNLVPYTQDAYTTLFLGDNTEVMNQLPKHHVDMVFADPPYNLQLGGDLYRPNHSKVDAVTDDWDQFDSFEAYDRFTRNWLKAVRRILKPDGTVWIIGSYHNIFRIGTILQDLGFWILNDIVWIKNNPMPNFKGTRFTNAHETMIWASRNPKSKYHFSYDSLKVFNEDKQMRSDWYIPICSGKERLRDEAKEKIHPTQKPKQLLYRILHASSKKNDLILDPFLGSGTTGAVAKELRRRFIGIDNCEKYVSASCQRIKQTQALSYSALEAYRNIKKTQPRIPFGSLVENKLLHSGTHIYDKHEQHAAIIQSDSSLNYNGYKGSIHKVGAYINNQQSCNGWAFWYYKNDRNELKPIEELREKMRHNLLCSS